MNINQSIIMIHNYPIGFHKKIEKKSFIIRNRNIMSSHGKNYED